MIDIGRMELKCRLRIISMHSTDLRGPVAATIGHSTERANGLQRYENSCRAPGCCNHLDGMPE
jgi:hypothetical protein